MTEEEKLTFALGAANGAVNTLLIDTTILESEVGALKAENKKLKEDVEAAVAFLPEQPNVAKVILKGIVD